MIIRSEKRCGCGSEAGLFRTLSGAAAARALPVVAVVSVALRKLGQPSVNAEILFGEEDERMMTMMTMRRRRMGRA